MTTVEFCDKLRASVSLRKELTEMVRDLMRRDGLTEEELLLRVDAVMVDDIEELRWRLKKLRYPTLAAAEERFAAAKKKLHLPEAIRLHPSPFFEKKELRLELKFRSPEELRQQLQKLNAVVNQEELKDLFL